MSYRPASEAATQPGGVAGVLSSLKPQQLHLALPNLKELGLKHELRTGMEVDRATPKRGREQVSDDPCGDPPEWCKTANKDLYKLDDAFPLRDMSTKVDDDKWLKEQGLKVFYDLNFPHTYAHSNGTTYVCIRFVLNYFDTSMLDHFEVDAAEFTKDVVALQADYNTLFEAVWSRLPKDGMLKNIGQEKNKTVEYQKDGNLNPDVVFVESGAWDKLLEEPDDTNKKKKKKLVGEKLDRNLRENLPKTKAFDSTTPWGKKTGIYTSAIYTQWSDGEASKGNHVVPFYAQSNKDGSGGISFSSLYLKLQQHNAMELIREYERKRSTAPGEASIMTEFKIQIQQHCGSIADVDQKANDFKTKVLASASKKLTWSAKDVEDFYTAFTTCAPEQLTKLKERAFHEEFKYSVERLKAVICELHELCKNLEGDIQKREKKMSDKSEEQGTAFAEKLGKQKAYDNWLKILAELRGKNTADLPDGFNDENDGAQYRDALKTFKANHNGTIATIQLAKKEAKSDAESGVMNEVLAMLKVVYDPKDANVNRYQNEFETRKTFPFLRRLVLYSIAIGADEANARKTGSAKAKPQSVAAKVLSIEEVMESSDLSYERLKQFMDNAALGPSDALDEVAKNTIKEKMLAAIQTKLLEQTALDKTLQKSIPDTSRDKRPYVTLAQKEGAGPLKAAYLHVSNLPVYQNDLKKLMPSEQWNELVLFLQGRRPATAKEAKDAKNAKGARDQEDDDKADPVSEMYEYFNFQRSDFQFGEALDQETLDVQGADRLEALRWYERRNELLQELKGRSKAGEETYAKRVASLLKLALDYYVANDEILDRIKTYLKDRLEFEIGEFRNKKEALQSKDWKNKVKVTVGNFQTQCERMDSFIDAKSSLTDASNNMELPTEILAVQQQMEQEESTTPAASTSDTPEDLEAEKREAGKLLDTADPTLQEAADEWLEFFMEQRVNYLNKEKLGSLIQPRKYDEEDTPPDRWYNSVQKILSWVDFVLKYASVSLRDAYAHFVKGYGDKERAAADMKTVAHNYLYRAQANQQERTSVFAAFNRVSDQVGGIPKPLKMRLFDKWWSNPETVWFEAYYHKWYESTTPRTLLSALRGVAQPCSSEELGGVFIKVAKANRSPRGLKFAATEFEYRPAEADGNCFYHVLGDSLQSYAEVQRDLHKMYIQDAAQQQDPTDKELKRVRKLLSKTLVQELIVNYLLNEGQYPNREKIQGEYEKPTTRDMGFVNFMKGKDQELVKKFREKWNTHDYYPPGNEKPTKPEHPWGDMADEEMTRQLLKYNAEYRGQDLTWADQTDLEINAMRLKRTFHVYQKQNARVVNGDTIYGHPINAGASDDKPLRLLYLFPVHYEGMAPGTPELPEQKVVFEASEVCSSVPTSSGVQQSFNNSVASTRDLKHDKDVMREIEQKLTQLTQEQIDTAMTHAEKSITAFEESILGNKSSKDSVLQRACADYLTIEEWDMAKSVKGDAMHTLVNAYDAEKAKADKEEKEEKVQKAKRTEEALKEISFLDIDTQVDAVRAKHGYYNDRYYDHWQTLFKVHTNWVRAQTSKTYEAVKQLGLLDTYRQQTFNELKADAQTREQENYDSFVEKTEEDRETRKATKNDREMRRAQRKQEARDRGDDPDSDYNEEDLKDALDTKQDEEDKKKANSAKNKEVKARDKTVKTKRHRAITQKLRKDLGDTAAEAAGAIVLFEADRQGAQEKFDDATKNPPTEAQVEEWLKRDKHEAPIDNQKYAFQEFTPEQFELLFLDEDNLKYNNEGEAGPTVDIDLTVSPPSAQDLAKDGASGVLQSSQIMGIRPAIFNKPYARHLLLQHLTLLQALDDRVTTEGKRETNFTKLGTCLQEKNETDLEGSADRLLPFFESMLRYRNTMIVAKLMLLNDEQNYKVEIKKLEQASQSGVTTNNSQKELRGLQVRPEFKLEAQRMILASRGRLPDPLVPSQPHFLPLRIFAPPRVGKSATALMTASLAKRLGMLCLYSVAPYKVQPIFELTQKLQRIGWTPGKDTTRSRNTKTEKGQQVVAVFQEAQKSGTSDEKEGKRYDTDTELGRLQKQYDELWERLSPRQKNKLTQLGFAPASSEEEEDTFEDNETEVLPDFQNVSFRIITSDDAMFRTQKNKAEYPYSDAIKGTGRSPRVDMIAYSSDTPVSDAKKMGSLLGNLMLTNTIVFHIRDEAQSLAKKDRDDHLAGVQDDPTVPDTLRYLRHYYGNLYGLNCNVTATHFPTLLEEEMWGFLGSVRQNLYAGFSPAADIDAISKGRVGARLLPKLVLALRPNIPQNYIGAKYLTTWQGRFLDMAGSISSKLKATELATQLAQFEKTAEQQEQEEEELQRLKIRADEAEAEANAEKEREEKEREEQAKAKVDAKKPKAAAKSKAAETAGGERRSERQAKAAKAEEKAEVLRKQAEELRKKRTPTRKERDAQINRKINEAEDAEKSTLLLNLFSNLTEEQRTLLLQANAEQQEVLIKVMQETNALVNYRDHFKDWLECEPEPINAQNIICKTYISALNHNVGDAGMLGFVRYYSELAHEKKCGLAMLVFCDSDYHNRGRLGEENIHLVGDLEQTEAGAKNALLFVYLPGDYDSGKKQIMLRAYKTTSADTAIKFVYDEHKITRTAILGYGKLKAGLTVQVFHKDKDDGLNYHFIAGYIAVAVAEDTPLDTQWQLVGRAFSDLKETPIPDNFKIQMLSTRNRVDTLKKYEEMEEWLAGNPAIRNMPLYKAVKTLFNLNEIEWQNYGKIGQRKMEFSDVLALPPATDLDKREKYNETALRQKVEQDEIERRQKELKEIADAEADSLRASPATVDEEGEEGEEADTSASAPMEVVDPVPSKASFVRTSLRTMRTGPLLKK